MLPSEIDFSATSEPALPRGLAIADEASSSLEEMAGTGEVLGLDVDGFPGSLIPLTGEGERRRGLSEHEGERTRFCLSPLALGGWPSQAALTEGVLTLVPSGG